MNQQQQAGQHLPNHGAALPALGHPGGGPPPLPLPPGPPPPPPQQGGPAGPLQHPLPPGPPHVLQPQLPLPPGPPPLPPQQGGSAGPPQLPMPPGAHPPPQQQGGPAGPPQPPLPPGFPQPQGGSAGSQQPLPPQRGPAGAPPPAPPQQIGLGGGLPPPPPPPGGHGGAHPLPPPLLQPRHRPQGQQPPLPRQHYQPPQPPAPYPQPPVPGRATHAYPGHQPLSVYGPLHHGHAPPQPYGGAVAPHHVYATPPTTLDNPGQGLPVRLESHKHRDSISSHIIRMMGGSPKAVGTPIFQGPPIAPPTELTHRQDPSLFCNRLSDAFRIAGMGVMKLEEDVPAAAGAANVMKAWPDECSSFRLGLLYGMLPPTMAVTSAITRGHDIQVHNLNGGMSWIKFEHFTSKDALRLLVSEIARQGLSGRHARQALGRIRLKDGESWETGLSRLVELARAAAVLPDRPYLSEETYYWMVLTTEDLHHLLNRAVAMCFPQADQTPFIAHLVGVMGHNKTMLEQYPIDTHALGSPQMRLRGQICHDCFRAFVTTLGDNSQFYAPQPADVAAIQTKSLRLPPGEDTFSRQVRQSGTVFAMEGGDSSSESDEDTLDLAALDGARAAHRDKPDRFTGRGSGRRDRDRRAGRYASTTFGSEPRKRERDPRPIPTSDTPSRDSRRPRRSADPPVPPTEQEQPTRAPQLPPDAPSPDADPKVIQAFIFKHKVCFNHAHGRRCRRMAETHHCPYLHTETTIPFKAYPKDPPTPRPALAAYGDYDENILYVLNALSAWSDLTAACPAAGDAGEST